MPENRLKGQSFLGFLEAVGALYGAETVDRTLARCPDDVATAIREGAIAPANWYPMSWYAALLRATEEACPELPNLFRTLSREATLRDVHGIYKFILSILSPETVMRHAPRLFGLYNSGGKITIDHCRPGHVRLHYSDCFGADHRVWEDAIGGTEAILEASGAKDVKIDLHAGGGDGDTTMYLEIFWSASRPGYRNEHPEPPEHRGHPGQA